MLDTLQYFKATSRFGPASTGSQRTNPGHESDDARRVFLILSNGALSTRQAAVRHIPIQQAAATQLMYDLLKQPELDSQTLLNHIRQYAKFVVSSVIVWKRSHRTCEIVL
ncbi:hypothetical protein BDZ89DRAFT_1134657 [Hymenopellis radicata]|nr:hypothetical protein BDZ89DRAFT_1134657 [Hymenopellis radicata]